MPAGKTLHYSKGPRGGRPLCAERNARMKCFVQKAMVVLHGGHVLMLLPKLMLIPQVALFDYLA